MLSLLAAVVWTFWISVVMAASAIALVVVIFVLFLKKVVAPQYPKR